MNIVIPKIKIMILAGRRILSAIKLSWINGDDAFLSIRTNKANDPNDKKANEIIEICVEDATTLLVLLPLFPIYVSVSRNEVIVTAKVMAPFTSMLLLPVITL
ncbi:MAG TPA: hypothetical protein VFI70_02660 [Nitrososphaeraceae archaeon]|nr:hypothetical protein [Nitrososphaeraceae archaeon]